MRLYLYYGICILLLPFAQAVVFHDYPKPIINLTLTDGTAAYNLTQDMPYYLSCFFNLGAPYYGSVTGPASEMVNITPNAAHRQINITFGYNNSGVYTQGCEIPVGTNTIINNYFGIGLMCKWHNSTLIDSATGEFFPWNISTSGTRTNGHSRWLGTQYYGTLQGFRCYDGDGYGIGNTNTLTDAVVNGAYYYNFYLFHPELHSQPDINYYETYALSHSGTIFNNKSAGKLGIEFNDCSEDFDDLIEQTHLKYENDSRVYIAGLEDWGTTGYDVSDMSQKSQFGILGSVFETCTGNQIEIYRRNILTLSAHFGLYNYMGNFDIKDSVVNSLSTGWFELSTSTWENSRINSIASTLTMTQANLTDVAVNNNGNNPTFYGYSGKNVGGIKIVDHTYIQNRYPLHDGNYTNVDHYNTRVYSTVGTDAVSLNITYMQDLNFYNYGTTTWADVWLDSISTRTQPFNFYCVNCQCNRLDGRCITLFSARAWQYEGMINISYMSYFDFYTKENKNESLAGASISIVDDNGNSYSGVTDSDGNYRFMVMNYMCFYNVSVPIYFNTCSYNNYWDVTISKDGYITQEIQINEYGNQERSILMIKPEFQYVEIFDHANGYLKLYG